VRALTKYGNLAIGDLSGRGGSTALGPATQRPGGGRSRSTTSPACAGCEVSSAHDACAPRLEEEHARDPPRPARSPRWKPPRPSVRTAWARGEAGPTERDRGQPAAGQAIEIVDSPDEPDDPPDEEWMRGIDERRPHQPGVQGVLLSHVPSRSGDDYTTLRLPEDSRKTGAIAVRIVTRA
jgi:hypothetical protein